MCLIRKITLFILILFNLNVANAAIKVRFLNGIQNSETLAKDNLGALKDKYQLYRKNSDPAVAEIDWDIYYNPEGSFVVDNIELSIQGTISGLAQAMASADASYQAIRSKWLGVSLSNETIKALTEIKYKLYLRDYINFYLYSRGKGGSVKISSTIANTLRQVREDISDGSKLVIVSHSQGNFFAEELNSQLTANERASVRFVGVASVASTTPNGRYVSLSGDGAVFSAYRQLLKAVAPLMSDPLPANVEGYYSGNDGIADLWDYITSPVCAARSVKCIEYSGHGFSTVYLSSDVQQSSTDLTAVSSKIISLLSDSIAEIASKTGADEYSQVQISGTSIDPTITLFTGAGAGGLSNAQMAPNDAGVAYGIANYTQGGQTKLGIFFLNQPGGSWYLATDTAQAYTSSSLVGANDLGQAIIQDIDTRTLPAVTRYSYVSKANDGSLYKLILNVPSDVTLRGILNDGSLVGIKGYDTILFNKTMNPISTLVGNTFLLFGLDGAFYDQRYAPSGDVYKQVRFADGSTQNLPCNGGFSNLALSKPTTGRNCSQITALSGNGVAVGLYYSSDGTQGVYKFSKTGFQEIPIAAQYFGYGTGANTYSPPRPLGISNAGDILLSPTYSDENAQTCVGGPYLLRGSTLIDLKKYIPSGSCFNIQASISGGGRIYLSSQAQGYSGYLVKN